MRIAIFTPEFTPETQGGIATYTKHLSELLNDEADIEIFAASFLHTVTEQTGNLIIHRIKTDHYNNFKYDVVSFFAQRHKTNRFTLIESSEVHACALEVKKHFPEIPLIVRLHTPGVLVTNLLRTYQSLFVKLRFVAGSIIRLKPDLGYWSKHDKNAANDPEYQICMLADKISAPSEIMKQWAIRFWQINKTKITVIPNPVMCSKSLFDIKPNKKATVITFYGRLNVLKGMIAYTKAIKLVLGKHPNVHFKIIGKSENSHKENLLMIDFMKNELKNNLDSVTFTDSFLPDKLVDILTNTDICVFPSLFESFSYVCAEAMCAGKAIVGSNKTAMTDLLDNGNCGTLVSPHKPAQIANAINTYITDNELRIKHGEKARNRILNFYNSEVIKQQYLDFYNLKEKQ